MTLKNGFRGRRLLLGMGLVAALVIGTTACTDDNSDTGKVVSITDGDTLVANVNGENQTIRLLNIDTPETKNPNTPPECLGEEATEFLRELLPIDSRIKLMYDVERTDQYDRTLAAVFTPSDVFVSAEIAKAGLGTAVVFGKNSKFLPPVEEAEAEAKASSRGIFDPDLECTLPGQVAAATSALETIVATESGSTAAATGAPITLAASSLATAKALLAALKAGTSTAGIIAWTAFEGPELESHVNLLSTKIQKAESNVAVLTRKEAAQQKSEAEAAARKAAAEAKAKQDAAEAKAQKEQAAKQAEAAAVAKSQAEAAAAAEAERIRNLPPVYAPPAPAPYVPPAYVPPVQDTGGGYPGYTGPRCYAPGGKTYRPC